MFRARNIQYMVVGSNSRISFLIRIGLKRSSTAMKEKGKVVENERTVRVVEKGNLQRGTLLEILTMGDFRLIQFRYKTDKSNLDLSLQNARNYLVINHIVFLRSLRQVELLSP